MEYIDLLLTMAILVLAALLAWPFIRYRRKKIDWFVKRWAEENGFELVSWQEKFPGPFFFTSNAQELVFVEIKNGAGLQQRCWLKLGGLFTGLSTNAVHCTWVK